MENKIILYSYYRSSCSYRVRLALNYKLLNYQLIPINLVQKDQNSIDFRTINPKGEVPVLEIQDHTNSKTLRLTQSMAILLHLEQLYDIPGKKLLPPDNTLRSYCMELCEIINSGIQPLQNLRVLDYLESVSSKADRETWTKQWIKLGLESFNERYLSILKEFPQIGASPTFTLGETFSLVDVFLLPQLYNALRFGLKLEQYPLLFNIYNHCLTLKYVKESVPEAQIDFPKN